MSFFRRNKSTVAPAQEAADCGNHSDVFMTVCTCAEQPRLANPHSHRPHSFKSSLIGEFEMAAVTAFKFGDADLAGEFLALAPVAESLAGSLEVVGIQLRMETLGFREWQLLPQLPAEQRLFLSLSGNAGDAYSSWFLGLRATKRATPTGESVLGKDVWQTLSPSAQEAIDLLLAGYERLAEKTLVLRGRLVERKLEDDQRTVEKRSTLQVAPAVLDRINATLALI